MADVQARAVVPQESARTAPGMPKEIKNKLLKAGIAFVLLFLIVFAIYQCARHLTVELNTLRTQEIVDTVYADLELWVFRDEQPVSAQAGNVFCYNVRDGEKVPVGTVLGQAYTADAEQVQALQKQLNSYGVRIAELSRIFGHTAPTDAQDAADSLALAGLDDANRRSVANALTDMDYSVLRLDLRRTSADEAALGIRLEGSATRGEVTVPVVLNITLHGAIEQLINTGLKLNSKKGKAK